MKFLAVRGGRTDRRVVGRLFCDYFFQGMYARDFHAFADNALGLRRDLAGGGDPRRRGCVLAIGAARDSVVGRAVRKHETGSAKSEQARDLAAIWPSAES